MNEENKLAIFQGKQIRKIFHNEEWWFSVIDLINALEISMDARNYWKVLKSRLIQEGSDQTVTNCNQLKLMAVDGKYRKTDCANTETALRIIQSIPSPKADLESKISQSIISKENYLPKSEGKKLSKIRKEK